MTNFQEIVQETRESMMQQNQKNIERLNALLADRGIVVGVEPAKWGADAVTVSSEDKGYFAGNFEMDPETLLWRIVNTLNYFGIKSTDL